MGINWYSRFNEADFLGPAISAVPEERHTLKLNLSEFEREVLLNVLRRESYNPIVKKIYHDIMQVSDG